MRQLGFCTLLTMLALLPAAAGAEIRWLNSIDEARRVAAQTNRLVLVHFWSTSCMPCVKLEKTVYSAQTPGLVERIHVFRSAFSRHKRR